MSQFAAMLEAAGMTSGPVYATGILKGYEAARMVADTRSQHTIRPMTDAVLLESDKGSTAYIVDRLATFYHSDYVKQNQPCILETPFEQWRDKELARRGLTIDD